MSIMFTSNKNYLKLRDVKAEIMSKPNVLNPVTFNYEGTFTVFHNLGYIPLVRAWYNYNNTDVIMPTNGQAGVRTGFGPTVDYWFYIDDITTSSVTFKSEDFSSRSGTFTFYYKIYYDKEA